MKRWIEIDGLAYKVDTAGKTHRWREYCVTCRAKTQIRVVQGTLGPRRMTAAVDGTSALADAEMLLDNTVHFPLCSVCGTRGRYPLEFR